MKTVWNAFKEVNTTGKVVDLEEIRLKYGEFAWARLVKILEEITGESWR